MVACKYSMRADVLGKSYAHTAAVGVVHCIHGVWKAVLSQLIEVVGVVS